MEDNFLHTNQVFDIEYNLIDLSEYESFTYTNNILHLKSIVTTDVNHNAKRVAYNMLNKLTDPFIVSILTDNLEMFKILEPVVSLRDSINSPLGAAICKSKKIFEYLCNKYSFQNCNYFIAYTVYSKDAYWVISLINNFSINVDSNECCFWKYAYRMGMIEIYKKLLDN